MKILSRFLLFACLAPGVMFARERVWGFCTQGGRTITVAGVPSNPAMPLMASYTNCTVTVFITGSGGTKANLYQDNSGTPLSNPFTVGQAPENSTNGYWFFYVDNGTYDVQEAGPGITSSLPSVQPQILYVTTAPNGSCTVGQTLGLQIVVSTLAQWSCEGSTIGGAGTWVQISSGGGGGSVVQCAGNPGNTTGAYLSLCQTSGATPKQYQCANSSGCGLAADWYATFPYTVGTSANNLLQLNGSGQIPAAGGYLGNAATASALASSPSLCSTGYAPTGILANGNATGCAAIGGGGGMVYPGAGVPNSSGSAWLTSYTVGTAAGNLVQLTGSAQLPAVSAALLTNFPTLNQNTTGNAATATALSATPTQCSGGTPLSTGIQANGNANCTSGAGGAGAVPYLLCASGCPATIPASGGAILASNHGQGIYAWAQALNSTSNPAEYEPMKQTVNPTTGDITIYYSIAPALIRIVGGTGGMVNPMNAANQTIASLTSSGVPTAVNIPSCSAPNDALIWTLGSGYGCNTIATGTSQTIYAATYNFSAQAPGGTLTATIAATVTLTPCPGGVNGADTGHYLYVSGGTGTAESVLIAGGTCVAGNSTGTVIFTTVNNHSGAWTIQSATSGLQEAANANPTQQVKVQCGGVNWYGPYNPPADHPGFIGCGAAYGTAIKLYFNSGNVVTVTADGGDISPTFSNFSIYPNSGDMTSGAMFYASSSQDGFNVQNVSIGVNGTRSAYVGIDCESYNCKGDWIDIWFAYRGVYLAADAHFSHVHTSTDKTTGTYAAGSASLYMAYATGTQIDNWMHDAGVVESCIVGDATSNAVNEVMLTQVYCDHMALYGIHQVSTAHQAIWWTLVNAEFSDNSGLGTATPPIVVTSVAQNWRIDAIRINTSPWPSITESGGTLTTWLGAPVVALGSTGTVTTISPCLSIWQTVTLVNTLGAGAITVGGGGNIPATYNLSNNAKLTLNCSGPAGSWY